MRIYFISFLIITFSVTAFAKSEINCIWLKHADNSLSCVMLEEKPQIHFEGESIVIDSKSYLIDDIVSYSFGNSEESSVNNIYGDAPYVVFKDNEIVIYRNTGNMIDSKCSIYDTKGTQIKTFKVDNACQPTRIDITDLTAGVYLLSFQRSTLKFIKK